jgi:hypothetical protein
MTVSRATFCGAFLAKLNCMGGTRTDQQLCRHDGGPRLHFLLPSLTRALVVHFWLL